MFLSEPPQTQYDVHFKLGEFPVRIHPFFWLTALLLSPIRENPVQLVLWVPAVMISILVHELGHAIAFRFYGINSSIILYGMGGLAVPSSTSRRRGPLRPIEQIVISLAGPFAGFALGAALLMAMHVTGYRDVELDKYWLPEFFDSSNLAIFIFFMLYINIFWGLVNLLPIYPLDGGQVSQQLFVMFHPEDPIRPSLILSIAVAIGMALFLASRAHSKNDAMFNVLLFGMLAWQNYMMLQSLEPRERWR